MVCLVVDKDTQEKVLMTPNALADLKKFYVSRFASTYMIEFFFWGSRTAFFLTVFRWESS